MVQVGYSLEQLREAVRVAVNIAIENTKPPTCGNLPNFDSHNAAKKCNEYIATLTASCPVSEWVKCEDGLPENGQDVLVTNGDACMVLVFNKYNFDNYNGKIDWWNSNDVTHWMPLPTPPTTK